MGTNRRHFACFLFWAFVVYNKQYHPKAKPQRTHDELPLYYLSVCCMPQARRRGACMLIQQRWVGIGSRQVHCCNKLLCVPRSIDALNTSCLCCHRNAKQIHRVMRDRNEQHTTVIRHTAGKGFGQYERVRRKERNQHENTFKQSRQQCISTARRQAVQSTKYK